jgi:GTP-binding protein
MKIRDARFVASAPSTEVLPAPAFAEVAFAGRSNVGKSTLINALLGRKKLVRTSSTPGATRTLNLFRVEIIEPEAVLDFVDLPGYGYAKRSKTERRSWGPLVEGFLASRAGLRAVVCIVDARRGFEEDDLGLLELVAREKHVALPVATKLDKLASSKRKPRIAELTRAVGRPVLGVSATAPDGIDALWRALLRAAAVDSERAK